MTDKNSSFVISLDFELYWGVRDNRTIESYKNNLLGVRSVVPTLLNLFKKYEIHTTWASVGFLFFDTHAELLEGLPSQRPKYSNSNFSPYEYVNRIGSNEREDPFHYALSLIKLIANYPYQEIGTHTFSHYYCLEKGQTIENFQEDLEAAKKAAKKYNLNLESLVFPRNQFNSQYVEACKAMGIKAYRGNEHSWLYTARSQENESLVRRAIRLVDAYVNLSGHNSYSANEILGNFPFNIPSSRFLRPYGNRLKLLEPLRLQRILSDMTYAAKKGHVYHLWWHPHNFGSYLNENLSFLQKVLEHYLKLRDSYGMESLNMGELSHRLMKVSNLDVKNEWLSSIT